MSEFLLELLSEEIPPAMQEPAADNLARLFQQRLEAEGCEAHLVAKFSTPRRIGVCFDGLPAERPAKTETRRGPKLTAPPQAIDGFKRSVSGLDVHIIERDDYYFAEITRPAANMRDLLGEIIPALLKNFPWPKSMRWPQGDDFRWVRPLRSMLCILDSKIVPFSVGDVAASDITKGHVVNHPDIIKISSFDEYKTKLREAHVLIDSQERREEIIRQAEQFIPHFSSEDMEKVPPALRAQLINFSEWPRLKEGKSSMDITKGRIILTNAIIRKEHCLTSGTVEEDTSLDDRFLMPIDGEKEKQAYENIIKGYELVIKARLHDGRFSLLQDKKTGLKKLKERLKDIVFHQKLGSMFDKSSRFEKLSKGQIMKRALGEQKSDSSSIIAIAADYAKADLASITVNDFPEARGEIGADLFAEENKNMDKEKRGQIVRSIGGHYVPQGKSDLVPSTLPGAVLSIADRADTLAGFFSIGEVPTGSKDPFALRRSAIGIIQIILSDIDYAKNHLNILDLNDLFAEALDLYNITDKSEILAALRHFMAERLKYHLRAESQRADLVDAAMRAETGLNLRRIHNRLNALADFLTNPDGVHLMTAWRRVSGILKNTAAPALAADKLTEPAEQALADALNMEDYEAALARHDFAAAFALLAGLRPAVDAFFEAVRVNVDDRQIRANRLALCAALRDIMSRAADFSSISGRS